MSTNLAERPQTHAVSIPTFAECKFTTVSLTIPKGMKFERWLELGEFLRAAGKGVQFWIGDWIRFGEHEYGEMYSQAIEATGKEETTLQNWVYVAENVHSSRRRELDIVDFSTHAEVASLPAEDQERILAEAEKNDLTVKQVRREVHKVQRRLGKRKSEIEVLQTPEVQSWLSGLHKSLLEHEPTVPTSAPFLRNMIRSMVGVVLQQSERTVESDCEAILKMFKGDAGSEGVYSATDDDIFKWLLARFYFMRDPELDDRLELMSWHSELEREAAEKRLSPHRLDCKCLDLNKRLKKESQGGKKDTQRGDMPDVYMLYDSRSGDAYNSRKANSIYSQGEAD